jgi:hypothetical protein
MKSIYYDICSSKLIYPGYDSYDANDKKLQQAQYDFHLLLFQDLDLGCARNLDSIISITNKPLPLWTVVLIKILKFKLDNIKHIVDKYEINN